MMMFGVWGETKVGIKRAGLICRIIFTSKYLSITTFKLSANRDLQYGNTEKFVAGRINTKPQYLSSS